MNATVSDGVVRLWGNVESKTMKKVVEVAADFDIACLWINDSHSLCPTVR